MAQQQYPPHGHYAGSAQPQAKKPRRVFMWVFLAINALFAVWLIAGLNSVSTAENCAGQTGSALEACQAGTAVGGGIGAMLILGLWAFVDFILFVVWVVVRMSRR